MGLMMCDGKFVSRDEIALVPTPYGTDSWKPVPHMEVIDAVTDVVTKAKTPTVNNHYTLRTDDELNRFVSLANQIEKSVNSGNFYPNETGFGCGECPYADRCKKWR